MPRTVYEQLVTSRTQLLSGEVTPPRTNGLVMRMFPHNEKVTNFQCSLIKVVVRHKLVRKVSLLLRFRNRDSHPGKPGSSDLARTC